MKFASNFRNYFIKQDPKTQKWIIAASVLVLAALTVLPIGVSRAYRFITADPKLERELCDASINGDLPKVKKLVASGVNVNTSVYKTANPLTLAILSAAPSSVDAYATESERMNRLALVRFLIDSGADVNRGDAANSPLEIARQVDDDGDLETLLINSGANPNAAPQKGDGKPMPKKVTASLMKVAYYSEATNAAKKVVENEKKKIVDGK